MSGAPSVCVSGVVGANLDLSVSKAFLATIEVRGKHRGEKFRSSAVTLLKKRLCLVQQHQVSNLVGLLAAVDPSESRAFSTQLQELLHREPTPLQCPLLEVRTFRVELEGQPCISFLQVVHLRNVTQNS